MMKCAGISTGTERCAYTCKHPHPHRRERANRHDCKAQQCKGTTCGMMDKCDPLWAPETRDRQHTHMVDAHLCWVSASRMGPSSSSAPPAAPACTHSPLRSMPALLSRQTTSVHPAPCSSTRCCSSSSAVSSPDCFLPPSLGSIERRRGAPERVNHVKSFPRTQEVHPVVKIAGGSVKRARGGGRLESAGCGRAACGARVTPIFDTHICQRGARARRATDCCPALAGCLPPATTRRHARSSTMMCR